MGRNCWLFCEGLRRKELRRRWLRMCSVLIVSVVSGPFISQGQNNVAGEKPSAESQVVMEGGSSVGNIHVFAFAGDRRIAPLGIEYDRHSWGSGFGFSPVGVRLLWRRHAAFRPYLMGKGGLLIFPDPVLSPLDGHLNFSAQFGGGVEETLARRVSLRLGYSDFHMSNAGLLRGILESTSCISMPGWSIG